MNEQLLIARAFQFASTLLLAGTIMFRCFVATPVFRAKAVGALEDGLRARLTRIVWAALAVAMLSGAAWLVFVAAEIGGSSVADAMSQGLAGIVLTQTAFGDAWMLRLEMAALCYGPLYSLAEIRQNVGAVLPRRLGYVRGASLEPIETYAAPIPDEALVKYDDAARTGLFSKFWVATPTYYQERQVDPWIVAEVDGSDRWAVIARWDV